MSLAPFIVLAIATLVTVAAFEAEGRDGTDGRKYDDYWALPDPFLHMAMVARQPGAAW